VSVRELAAVAARGGVGATTVASTAHLAARAGITVFATGGLGGVHRGAAQTWDESGDLTTLSRTPALVVCAGVKSPAELADVLRARDSLGTDGYGMVLANPIAAADELDRALHDEVLASGLAAATAHAVTGKDVTPFLLDWFHRETHGAPLAANVALVRANARLAAEYART
jgi:pseudouridine-5'-phosphate glycosidase